jgi:hypothetical protein
MGSGIRRGPGALPRWEAGSGAVGRVAAPKPSEQGCGVLAGCTTAPEPSCIGRLGLVLRDTRQCDVARPASRHSFGACMRGYPVCRVPTIME